MLIVFLDLLRFPFPTGDEALRLRPELSPLVDFVRAGAEVDADVEVDADAKVDPDAEVDDESGQNLPAVWSF